MNWVGRVIRILLVLAGLGPALAAPDGLVWSDGAGFRSAPVRPVVGRGTAGFTLVPSLSSGIRFTNALTGDLYLTNAVAHNGAGVAVGDMDADGWPDIFFCNLEGPNRLYRNLGGWRFEERDPGEAACAGQLSTGAAFADVDGDGDLDLLVNGIAVGTRLFLNDGSGRWQESKDSGLSKTASSTSMALADMDGDGDLDLYCTHFIDEMLLADPTTRFAMAKRGDQWEVARVNGESTRAPRWKGRFEALPDGKVRELPEVHGLYRNDGKGRFTAIEFEPGTYMNEKGEPIPPYRDWGLAVMFRDINGDGSPDLYICNDNTSPDRIWINTGKGTFRAIDPVAFRHTSRSSMGVDFGDINRDGQDDIIVVDMLARDPQKRMTQLVRDRPQLHDIERANERPQFNRNTLFFGRSDGTFVEAALMAGVAATDWTWTTLFLDVDLDGYEDLLVTNGFEFDVMDQDSQDEIKDPRRRLTEAQLKRSMQLRPRWPTRNAAFRNRGDGTFEPAGAAWGFDHLGVSFGMAQGDFDNDGDLDLVVNNLNEEASLYRNDSPAPRVAVRLKGVKPNSHGVGARISLIGATFTQAQEMISGGRYLSGDQPIRVFAADPDPARPMRIEVRWRNGALTTLADVTTNRVYEITQPADAAPVPRAVPVPPVGWFKDVSGLLNHAHVEAPFDDWERQGMLPRRLSHLGPGIAWSDVDGDGWEDLLVAGARGGQSAVFKNQQGAGFLPNPAGAAAVGDEGAVLGWHDGQGNRRIVRALSGYETPAGGPSHLLVAAPGPGAPAEPLPLGGSSPGPVCAADIDGDGDLDLFVGGRFVPGRYPEAPSSVVLRNDMGRLVADGAWSKPFQSLGMVAGATFADLDGDARVDLALAMEWGPIRVFRNQGTGFVDITPTLGLGNKTGWWTGVVAGDFDGDGRVDLACGNWGRNSIYELHQPGPIRLFHGDWAGDGIVRMMEAWGSGTNWFPMRDRAWLSRGYPELGLQTPSFKAFGEATIQQVLGPAYEKSAVLEVRDLASTLFLNRGDRFEPVPLPREAQLAPVFSVNVGDANADGIEDLFLSQNFFGTASDMTRDDGGRGLWLEGRGGGRFTPVDAAQSGIRVYGEQRGAALADLNHDGRVDLAVTQNNGPTRLYLNQTPKQGLRVVLQGPPANPEAVGAHLRVVYAGDRMGPCRVVQAGSGYLSQDAATQILGLQETPIALWIRWPGGKQQTVPLRDKQSELRVAFEK